MQKFFAKQKLNNAFTLTEVMVTVIILAAILAIGVLHFRRTVEREYERDAVLNLQAIHSANQIYRSRNGVYWPQTNDQDVAAINSNLGLEIQEEGMTYICSGSGTSFTCEAERKPPADSFVVAVTEAPLTATNPACTKGACP